MRRVRAFLARLLNSLLGSHARRFDADLRAELESHLNMQIEDNLRRGLPPDEARRQALLAAGGLTAAAESVREQRGLPWLDHAKQDVVYALRVMRGNPAVAAAIVLTLALGIGGTTSIFGVVHSVLLRPLPYADGDRIVYLRETLNGTFGNASVGHFHDWTEQSRSFSATAAVQGGNVNLTDGEPLRLDAVRATPSVFQVLHLPPALGRYFLADETVDSRVAVLSYPLWNSRFDGDSSIVGREITLDGQKYTVVGVTPAAFTLTPFDPQLWMPLSFTPAQRTNYGAHFLAVVGKLKPGISVQEAQRDLERVTEDIRRRHPDDMRNRGVSVESFGETIVGDYRTQLWVLLGAVTVVLLIGCGNIASLLLARATARRKEIAVRGALGAARPRLVRQLLTESLLLALAGGAAGLVVAYFGIRFLTAMGPQGLPRLADAALDPAVVVFALASTIGCSILFGLAPALRATRGALVAQLREGGRGSSSVVHDRVRAALIVTEIAVALVLLVSAALLLRSAERLGQVPVGFDPDGITVMRLGLPADRYDTPEAVEGAFRRIVEQVRAIPGVRDAGAGTRVPMLGGSIDMGVTVEGRQANPDRMDLGHVRMVTDGFMEALGMRLERGRLLMETDMSAGAPWVVVVNETFARRVFGDEDPIGRRISGWTSGEAPEWREIVGVVADVRAFGLENDPPPEIYLPMTQAPDGAWPAFGRTMAIVARSEARIPIAGAMRNAVRSMDPTLPLFDLRTMNDILSESTEARRFNTLLLSFLGLSGLILAAVGIYGVIAFLVSQRSREIGVRIALGATTRDVIRMVVMQAAILALTGVALGSAAAYWSTRVLRSMLFGIDARDPIAYAVAAAVLVLVALLAALPPARRAARADPVRALASG